VPAPHWGGRVAAFSVERLAEVFQLRLLLGVVSHEPCWGCNAGGGAYVKQSGGGGKSACGCRRGAPRSPNEDFHYWIYSADGGYLLTMFIQQA